MLSVVVAPRAFHNDITTAHHVGSGCFGSMSFLFIFARVACVIGVDTKSVGPTIVHESTFVDRYLVLVCFGFIQCCDIFGLIVLLAALAP